MSSYSDSRTSRWVEDQNRRPRRNREYRTRGGTIIPDRSSMSPPSRSGSLIEQDHHDDDDDDDDDDSDRSTVKDNSRAVILYPSSAGESGLFGDEPDSGSATVDHSGYLVSLDQQTPQSHHGQSVHDSSPPPPPPPPYERSASAVSGHLPHYHDRTPAAPRVLARCGRSVSATFRPPVPSHQPEPPLPEVHTQHGSSSLAPGEFIYTTQVKIVFSEESGRPSPHRKHRRRSTTTRGATHE